MTKEQIRAMAFETIEALVGNPFEYVTDGSDESRTATELTIGTVYGILIFEAEMERKCDE